jgi:minor fimbrial subunit
MSNIYKSLMICLLYFQPLSGHAADTRIYVNGNLIGNTCTVSTQSKNMTVKMGNIGAKDFIRPSGDGLWAAEFPFAINLTDCQSESVGVKVHFLGSADTNNKELLKITGDGAQGIAIRLMDENKNPIAINQSSKVYEINPELDVNELIFYARYVLTQNKLTPGPANAVSTFMLEYL